MIENQSHSMQRRTFSIPIFYGVLSLISIKHVKAKSLATLKAQNLQTGLITRYNSIKQQSEMQIYTPH